MREHKKREKLAALLGLDVPTKASGPPRQVAKESRSREAEAVIQFVETPRAFAIVKCKNCGDEFLVNRGNVSMCSDTCRARALAKIGIEWDWSKNPAERWYATSVLSQTTNEPLIVPPQAFVALREVLGVWEPIVEASSLDEAADLDALVDSLLN